MMDAFESRRLDLQAKLDAGKSQYERNVLGQFATPSALATAIVQLGCDMIPPQEPIRFLDPAIGTGAFYSALLTVSQFRDIHAAVGYEIDSYYGEPSRELWKDTPLELRLADFTKAIPPQHDIQRYNLIICNPPYVRHHHLPPEEKRRLQHVTESVCGIRIGGLAGLYCYFLGLAHAWMSSDSVAIWLIPAEFMDVNYGSQLKRYLANEVSLMRVHRFDAEDVQFDDALVTSTVLMFKRTKPADDHVVEFSSGASLTAPSSSRLVSRASLLAESKWGRFFSSEIVDRRRGVRLEDIFTIRRGIATGANEFFIMTKEKIIEQGLPMEFFRPILPSPRYLDDDEVFADAEGKPLLNPPLFLLDCRLPEEQVRMQYPTLWNYLQSGVPEISERYLCRSRSPWYSQESRPVAPFVCTYMGREGGKKGRPFRFILNHSKAIAANVYLLLYPKPMIARAISENPMLGREIWNALTDIPLSRLFGEGRVYGGGLRKMEPNELANVSADNIAELLPSRIRPNGKDLSLSLF